MVTRFAVVVASAASMFCSVALAQTPAQQSPVRIRGDIVSFNGGALTVHRPTGDTVTVDVKPELAVSALRRLKLDDITPGTFIGTAATTGAHGTLRATEVVVFPESARGTGEGHYAWDFGPKSTMTNANVDAVVQGRHGRDLKLSYKGGSNMVTVPPGVPVVTFVPATQADLVPGKKVFVIATGAQPGTFVAQRIVVERDGVVPPM